MSLKTDILLIDDNLEDAELVLRALSKKNITSNIVHIQDAEEAMTHFFSENHSKENNVGYSPKMILLDLKMPKVNGIELLQKIKSDERYRYIPLIVFSSSNEKVDIAECYKYGANSYIVKPLIYENFIEVISHTVSYWILYNKSL